MILSAERLKGIAIEVFDFFYSEVRDCAPMPVFDFMQPYNFRLIYVLKYCESLIHWIFPPMVWMGVLQGRGLTCFIRVLCRCVVRLFLVTVEYE
jgi:hypothetical protein